MEEQGIVDQIEQCVLEGCMLRDMAEALATRDAQKESTGV